MHLEPRLTKHPVTGKRFWMMGHSQWGTAALSQKFHKSNSLSPATITHLQDHFRNVMLLGKWWAGCDPCHRVMEKLWTGPTGSAIHTMELDAAAAVLCCCGERGQDRRSWNEEGLLVLPGRQTSGGSLLKNVHLLTDCTLCSFHQPNADHWS